MSVIYGICYPGPRPVHRSELRLMETALNHWQADAGDAVIIDNTGLGHLMLWNTPESLHETLPYNNRGKQLTITADARIDNRDEITRLLGASANQFLPDSELILLLYERYGQSCVQYLSGDFVFAIWDERQQQLFCARDHLGVKPLFYYYDDKLFAFASEKKGILCIEGINKEIDMPFLYRQMQFQPVQFPDATLYKHIRRLQPAHTLVIQPAVSLIPKISRYWEPDVFTEIKLGDKRDYYEGLHHHFNEAVKARLRSVYPLGAELSGGIDSSAIVGVAQHLLQPTGGNIIPFSHVLPEGVTDEKLKLKEERRYIQEVIDFHQLKEYEFITSTGFNSVLEERDYALMVNDGLEAWGGVGLTAIKRKAQNIGIRTILSGFPGDELVTFRGQNYPLDYLDQKQYFKFLKMLRGRGLGKYLQLTLPHYLDKKLYKLKISLGSRDENTAFVDDIFCIPNKYRKEMAAPIWQNPYQQNRYKSYRHYQASRIMHPQVAGRMEAETRAGLYTRVEPRFPMADIRLIQFFLSMPNNLKYGQPFKRYTFIQSVLPYLPQAIATRHDKAGNVAPFRSLLLAEQLQTAIDIFKQIKNNRLINDSFPVENLNSVHLEKQWGLETMFLYKIDFFRWVQKNLQ